MDQSSDSDYLEGIVDGHQWSARWTAAVGNDSTTPHIPKWHVSVDGRMVFTRSSPMPFGDEPDPRPVDRQPRAAIERVVMEWLTKHPAT